MRECFMSLSPLVWASVVLKLLGVMVWPRCSTLVANQWHSFSFSKTPVAYTVRIIVMMSGRCWSWFFEKTVISSRYT